MEPNDYKDFKIEYGELDKYTISKKIGQGRYSNVFIGFINELNSNEQQIYNEFEKYISKERNIYERINQLKLQFKNHKFKLKTTNQKCIIKVLKPNKEIRFKREVYILKRLNHPNIVKLIDVIEDNISNQKSLIFEFTSLFNTRLLFLTMNFNDIKIYSKQILEGLDYAHKQGIVHRDIKPQNLIINPLTKSLRIIDWGIADNIKLCDSSRVGTKGYKAPELIFDLPYDYKIDIWGFGCVFCEMIFKKQLFKEGTDFESIISILGKEGSEEFLEKYNLPKLEYNEFYENSDYDLINNIENINLKTIISSSLIYDPEKRYSASNLLNTKLFKN